jgi:hypothetical protein
MSALTSKNLRAAGILAGLRRDEEPWELTIRPLAMRTFTINVSPSDTVKQLYEKVGIDTAMHVSMFELINNGLERGDNRIRLGQYYNDPRPISEMGIKNGSVLSLVLNLRGPRPIRRKNKSRKSTNRSRRTRRNRRA